MLNNGTARVFITRKPQVIILQKLDPTVSINTFTTGNHKICFGKEKTVSISIIQVSIPLGNITFHVLLTNTLFLYYLQDIDRMKVKLDNIQNILVQNKKIILIIRK
jgi:hypothetical protein